MASLTRSTHRGLTLAALVLSLAMAALEATVVATAMPTVTGELGGLEYYSWVTNAYLIMTAITVPIFGKLADLYGRKPILLFGIFVFLVGSIASGAARSMPMLIAFRALQGLGGGAMQPMPITIVGDIFRLDERAKVQSFFGAAWGFFGLVGPLIGGVIVEHVSWRWVFYMNVPFGIAAAVILYSAFHENIQRTKKPQLDVLGALLLVALVASILLAAGRSVPGHEGMLVIASVILLVAFILVERRAADPLLPLFLFKNRVIALSSIINAAAGGAMFSLLTYVPLFVQGVRHGTPTEAGTSIAPMLVAWPITSTIAGRLVLKVGFRPLIRAGIVCTAIGTLLLALVAHQQGLAVQMAMALFGVGMGLANIALIIAVQQSTTWEYRGVATASTMFFRIIGGTVAVGALGGVLIAGMSKDPTIPAGAASRLLSREGAVSIAPEMAEKIAGYLEVSLGQIFWLTTLLTGIAVICVVFYPHFKPSDGPSNASSGAPNAH
jgi:EmrB/QacA subfamily drug resistance transporter